MRMTIDKAIEILNHYSDYPQDEVTEASLLAIETRRNSMNKINSLKAEKVLDMIDNLLKENEDG